MITCQACQQSFDYDAEPEVNMGAVICPHCGVIVDQEGNVCGQPKWFPFEEN